MHLSWSNKKAADDVKSAVNGLISMSTLPKRRGPHAPVVKDRAKAEPCEKSISMGHAANGEGYATVSKADRACTS